MVTFTVIYEDASKVIYGYYPDGDKENEGQICVPSNGEAYLLKPAEGDEFGTYSYHVFSHIRQGEKTGMAAWY